MEDSDVDSDFKGVSVGVCVVGVCWSHRLGYEDNTPERFKSIGHCFYIYLHFDIWLFHIIMRATAAKKKKRKLGNKDCCTDEYKL